MKEESVLKVFFEIPDPRKSTEKRKLCKLWINHLRNDKLNIETFQWSKSRVVCQDHFTENCFETRSQSPWDLKQN